MRVPAARHGPFKPQEKHQPFPLDAWLFLPLRVAGGWGGVAGGVRASARDGQAPLGALDPIVRWALDSRGSVFKVFPLFLEALFFF